MNEKMRAARDFLSAYRVSMLQAEKCLEDYEEAHALAYAMTYGEGSHSAGKMAEGAIEMLRHADELKVEHVSLTDSYVKRNAVMLDVAARSPLHGEMLALVYARGMTVSEARRFLERERGCPYSPSGAYMLHYRALEMAHDAMVSIMAG